MSSPCTRACVLAWFWGFILSLYTCKHKGTGTILVTAVGSGGRHRPMPNSAYVRAPPHAVLATTSGYYSLLHLQACVCPSVSFFHSAPLAACVNDPCSSVGYPDNRCVDNRDGTYACICDHSGWYTTANAQACVGTIHKSVRSYFRLPSWCAVLFRIIAYIQLFQQIACTHLTFQRSSEGRQFCVSDECKTSMAEDNICYDLGTEGTILVQSMGRNTVLLECLSVRSLCQQEFYIH